MKSKVAKILTVLTIIVFVLGCKKNDGKGKLYLNLKSVNGSVFNNQELVVFSFEFSHPDNEVANDKLLVRRKFVNCTNTNNYDTIKLPQFTATKDYIGNFDFSFKNGSGASYSNPCFQGTTYRTDSLVYIFKLLDKNGVLTDSVVSPQITLKK